MTARWPKRGLLLAGVALLALLAAAWIDYALTSAALPEFDPNFEFDPANPTVKDPTELERGQLSHGYGIRAWLYMIAAVTAVVALTASALRTSSSGQRRELFTDLGVAGVVCGVIALVASSNEPDLIGNSNNGTVLWIPMLTLLTAAGAGTLVTSSRVTVAVGGGAGPEARPATPSQIPVTLGRVALALAALSWVLMIVGANSPACDVDEPSRSDLLVYMALGASLATTLCGMAALIGRRWVAALFTIPTPLFIFFGLYGSACYL